MMARFRIDDSLPTGSVGCVFAAEILEGEISSGMSFSVPEAGHKWRFVVKSIEQIRLIGGGEKVGLVVENPTTGYLPGLGVGWTAELKKQDEE
ncbi:MAG: hypothetical protein ACYC6N_28950 [Pirellulaceae bacterium]